MAAPPIVVPLITSGMPNLRPLAGGRISLVAMAVTPTLVGADGKTPGLVGSDAGVIPDRSLVTSVLVVVVLVAVTEAAISATAP